ncbi:hypothetical protein ALNOE001_16250 [Candidatus Methanobinarius endosymbioticus]|uniref:Uncharacterized protein n=1 Tax=Candidatus Methanobinarius endosymbioticus TaxID=2006182 RepID=A0A366M8W3_9EURY|nr:hypothetical protein ALNOE001_16250 [Candidatus Methanobinarius endosymbioticus]
MGSGQHTFHTKTITEMIIDVERWSNDTNTINWLKTFDSTQYIIIDDGGGNYYIIERSEHDQLKNNLTTKQLSPEHGYEPNIQTTILGEQTTQDRQNIYQIKNPELKNNTNMVKTT